MNLIPRIFGTTTAGLVCVFFVATARADDAPPVGAESYSSSHLTRAEAARRADRPHWAVEIAASPYTFGEQGVLSQYPAAETTGTSLQVEYQPGFVQRYGTLGIGPVFSAYPVSQGQGVTSSFFSVWSIGASARYQARFVHNQFLVPSIGYEVDRLRYSFTTGQQGQLMLSGPVAGLEFLLNTIDPERGAEFYESSGISHCYLIGEVRDLTGTDGAYTASGLSGYLGLRFEM